MMIVIVDRQARHQAICTSESSKIWKHMKFVGQLWCRVLLCVCVLEVMIQQTSLLLVT